MYEKPILDYGELSLRASLICSVGGQVYLCLTANLQNTCVYSPKTTALAQDTVLLSQRNVDKYSAEGRIADRKIVNKRDKWTSSEDAETVPLTIAEVT